MINVKFFKRTMKHPLHPTRQQNTFCNVVLIKSIIYWGKKNNVSYLENNKNY